MNKLTPYFLAVVLAIQVVQTFALLAIKSRTCGPFDYTAINRDQIDKLIELEHEGWVFVGTRQNYGGEQWVFSRPRN